MPLASITLNTTATSALYPNATPIIINAPINAQVTLDLDNQGRNIVTVVNAQTGSPITANVYPSQRVPIAEGYTVQFPDFVEVLSLYSAFSAPINVLNVELSATTNSRVTIVTTVQIYTLNLIATDKNKNTLQIFGNPEGLPINGSVTLQLISNVWQTL